jgi:peptidoglycan/LPS O-acetylase OafA/YrhL
MYSRSTTSRPQSAVSQLPSLTPLRGLAALWVVLFHYTALYFPNLDIRPLFAYRQRLSRRRSVFHAVRPGDDARLLPGVLRQREG